VTVRTPDSGFDALDRRYESQTRLVQYLLLAFPLLPYALVQKPSAGAFGITAGVVAAAAVWITWATMRHPRWASRPWTVRFYMAGLVTLIAVLTLRSPFFAFFSWLGFLHAFRFLTGAWRWAAALAVAVWFAVGQSGGFHRPDPAAVAIWTVLAGVDLLLVGVFTLLGIKTEEQNQARRGMIAELAQANQRLEEMIAENTGLQAQLLTQARQAGAGDERQRMAREIHDTLAQGLTGIVTQLEAAKQSGSEAERDKRMDNAKRLARDSLAEARRSVQALRPQALEDSRLPKALAKEVTCWSGTSAVAVEVSTTGDPRTLHPEIEVTLLRVAQEALANVAKHARASRAGVTLSYMEDVVTLDVRDDGTGFAVTGPAPDDGRSGGFGLIAMRQRVNRLAGQLEIESEPGTGTAVSATLPAIGVGESR
jgi:signal transduction histidine kinase